MIWIILALLAAFFTSMTTILAKIGIKNVNSNFATFIRTGVVILCSLLLCIINKDLTKSNQLTVNNYLFNDTTNNGNVLTITMLFLSMNLMFIGTLFMIGKKEGEETKSKLWLLFAVLSAVFASLVSLFVKIGLKGIPSNLGTLYRTIVVFIFSGIIVLCRKDYQGGKEITKKSWIFLILSGVSTGFAWLCEYEALNYVGANPIAVNSIGKLSILLTMFLSFAILKEKFTKKSCLGLALLTAGIILIIIFSL